MSMTNERKFTKGSMVIHKETQRVGSFAKYDVSSDEMCYVDFYGEIVGDEVQTERLHVVTNQLDFYTNSAEKTEGYAEDTNMEGHSLKDINYAVCVNWGCNETEGTYCEGELIKLSTPEEKEEAFQNDGFNFVGHCGQEGAECYCYATISEAVKNAHFNPFCLVYCGDFTEEEVAELHKAITEMYKAEKLDGYDIPDVKSLVENFAKDFKEKYHAVAKEEAVAEET